MSEPFRRCEDTVTAKYHVERLLRDVKLLEICEGTSEMLRRVIGITVLDEKINYIQR